jgi:hypothetical protein
MRAGHLFALLHGFQRLRSYFFPMLLLIIAQKIARRAWNQAAPLF